MAICWLKNPYCDVNFSGGLKETAVMRHDQLGE